MKEARSFRGTPAEQSVPAQPMATIAPAEVSIRRNGNCCSPRANVALAALDAARSIVSLSNRFLQACKTRALEFAARDSSGRVRERIKKTPARDTPQQ